VVPIVTQSIAAARAAAVFWSFTTGKPAVIVLERDGLCVLIGPHTEPELVVCRYDDGGKEITR
jgi:hypothetical protein